MTAAGTHNQDPRRTVGLGNGWAACVAVAPDGTESLWLVSPTPQAPQGCACPKCAPHDQHGAVTTTDTSTGSNA
jgi:hypothetical protein